MEHESKWEGGKVRDGSRKLRWCVAEAAFIRGSELTACRERESSDRDDCRGADMAYRRLGRKVALLIGFALVVLVLQMVAVSRIGTPTRYPWESEGRDGEPAAKRRREEAGTEQPPPLQHVSQGTRG